MRVIVAGVMVGAVLAGGCSTTGDFRRYAGPVRAAMPVERDIRCAGFLAGSWSGAHDGGEYEEYWTTDAGGVMTSTSRLVVDAKTVFFEFARVGLKDGKVVYFAQPAGRAPTEFVMTRWGCTKTSCFVRFENPEHDFPKVIQYSTGLRDGTAWLIAELEGDEKGVHTTDVIEMKRRR